jgi:hypothetical protein
MRKTAGRILRSSEVKLEGQIKLDVQHPETNPPQSTIAGPAMGQVRIVESNTESAVIEVLCCCGAKMYLRCQYSNEQ